MIDTMEPELIAIVIFLNKAPLSTADRFESFEGRAQIARSEPTNIDIRVGVSLEDKLARGIKFSSNKELLFARLRRNYCFVLFFSHLIISFLNICKIAYAMRNVPAV